MITTMNLMKIEGLRFDNEAGANVTRELQAVGHPRRRRTLEILVSHNRQMELMELTQRIRAASENTDRDDTERIRLSLYHQHVPKLEEAGFVEFDHEEEIITLTDQARDTYV